mmetsp:Transcript_26185/g.30008  ORF Transcript_26185/g.30008 Transcript_26185/m.30008 type:complete len:240 (+) Transcript_26185:1109-1828(+)
MCLGLAVIWLKLSVRAVMSASLLRFATLDFTASAKLSMISRESVLGVSSAKASPTIFPISVFRSAGGFEDESLSASALFFSAVRSFAQWPRASHILPEGQKSVAADLQLTHLSETHAGVWISLQSVFDVHAFSLPDGAEPVLAVVNTEGKYLVPLHLALFLSELMLEVANPSLVQGPWSPHVRHESSAKYPSVTATSHVNGLVRFSNSTSSSISPLETSMHNKEICKVLESNFSAAGTP